MRSNIAFALFVAMAVLALPARAATIDFEGLPAGTIVDQLSTGSGITGDLGGPVSVFGFNPALGLVNAAVVFDSSDPSGGDDDLGTPNEFFGGPGIGDAGAISNFTALGNILIIAQDLTDDSPADGLVDDPDDDDEVGAFIDFDFSGLGNGNGKKAGTVTVNSVTMLDIEAEQGEAGTFLELSGPDLPVNLIAIPPTGDNGVVVISGINLAGVSLLRINLNGSGATAGIVVEDADEPGECWFTFGGFQNAGIQAGGKDFTFGGNVGPPPSGVIEVIDHNTGDNFHTESVHIVECLVIEGTGPGQPGGKKGFTINKATFAGAGRLNGVSGFPFTGFVIDAGEPAGKKNNDKDFFEITVRNPGTNDIVFQASGELDGGNIQLHPPVGN